VIIMADVAVALRGDVTATLTGRQQHLDAAVALRPRLYGAPLYAAVDGRPGHPQPARGLADRQPVTLTVTMTVALIITVTVGHNVIP
jgi:hypothetical protein